MHRFRFLAIPEEDQIWLVDDPDEVRHALSVLRLSVGDEVEVTDACGKVGVGPITGTSKKSFRVHAPVKLHAPPDYKVSVAIGALKSGDIDEVIPFLSSLGIDEILVFGGPGVAKSRLQDKTAQRWSRIARQSVKQCKRAFAPTVEVFPHLQAMLTAQRCEAVVLGCLDVGGQPLSALPRDRDVLLVCGGEKGFVDEEYELLQGRKANVYGLGPYVLLARHAVCAAAVVVAQGRFPPD